MEQMPLVFASSHTVSVASVGEQFVVLVQFTARLPGTETDLPSMEIAIPLPEATDLAQEIQKRVIQASQMQQTRGTA